MRWITTLNGEQMNDNLETTTEENVEENKETQTSEEEKESFTKEELAEYVKAELEKQKKAEEERKKQEEEDKKLTQKQREERDLKNAQMKLKVDRLNFDISVYRNSLNLQKDDGTAALCDGAGSGYGWSCKRTD